MMLKKEMIKMVENNSVLVYDIEADSTDPNKAKLKWFGAYSYKDDKYYLLDYRKNVDIDNLIKSHKVLVGFNNKHYDDVIISRFFNDDEYFKYKVTVDLYEISAPKGNTEKSRYNKGKIVTMLQKKLKSYSLNNIIKAIGLNDSSGVKGDIDYSIFQKDSWSDDEIEEIKKYLKQDIVITKKLFEWYCEMFEPLKHFLSEKEQLKFTHITSSLSTISYKIICYQAGIEPIFAENHEKPKTKFSYPGGHHIKPRWSMVKGDIVEIDFSSAYPHAMIMGNLYSPDNDGWSGGDYYELDGVYNNKERGKIETALKSLLDERLKAKSNKKNSKSDAIKDKAYKVVINSAYGLTGNWRFKQLYNMNTAGDCTYIVRTWLKRLAKLVEENGFTCLYGFTDSIFVRIPPELSKDKLMYIVGKFIQDIKNHMPFPVDSFNMDIDEEMSMFWIHDLNCYLFVRKDGTVYEKKTLMPINAPDVVKKVYEEYMKNKISKELDINFTKQELESVLKDYIKKDLSLASELHSVRDTDSYNVKTSLQYQIAERYGEGKHNLIPNKINVGVGKSTSYCSIEEFKDNNMKVEDIDIEKMLKWYKPFIRENKTTQTKLNTKEKQNG